MKSPKAPFSMRIGCQSIITIILGIFLTIYVVRTYVMKHSIPDYYYVGQFNMNYFAMRINEIKVGFKDDKPYLWVFAYDGDRNYDYRIDVINPVDRKLVNSISCEESSSITAGSEMAAFEWYNNLFFAANDLLGVQGRAIDTGELTETAETLSKRFPELKQGIGKMKKESGNEDFYEVTTKDGLQYLYFPAKNILITKEEIENKERQFNNSDFSIDTTSKDVTLHYVWALTRQDEGIRQQLYLTKQYQYILSNPHFPADLKRLKEMAERYQKEMADLEEPVKESPTYWDRLNPKMKEKMIEMQKLRRETTLKRLTSQDIKSEKLVTLVPDKVFLNGKIIVSNSLFCVVLHSQTIEKDAKKVLTCVNQQGKILWELVNPDMESFEQLDAEHPQLSGIIHKNTIVLINNTYYNKAVCALDIQTGKVLWEFIAF